MINNEENKKQIHFTFDKSFQEKIVQGMILDQVWASQFTEVINLDFFEYSYLKIVADKYISYYRKYKEFPTLELLTTIVVQELSNNKDAALKQQVQLLFQKFIKNENLGDLPYVKERSLEFCKKQALQNALEKCVELVVHEDYDKVSSVMKEALAAGTTQTPGLSLNDDIDARYSETYRKTVPTGLPELDKREILNGGLGAGEVGVVVAPTGVGKSHFLVHVAAQAVQKGKNVLFYTFELNERNVGIRFDSHIVDISSTYCFDNIQKIKDHYSDHSEYGKLLIKYYPTSTVTCLNIRNHVERLAATGYRPDLIVIDYAGIMRSSEKYDAPRFELKKIFEELRGMAGELNVPVWTAVQSNKEGANADVVGMENMAESYGQAHICDFIVGLSRKPVEKATGYGTLFIAKNRAGTDGIQFQIHLDTSKSKLRIVDKIDLDALQKNSLNNKDGSSEGNFLRELRNDLAKKREEKNGISIEKIF